MTGFDGVLGSQPFGAVAGAWHGGVLLDSAASGFARAYELVDGAPLPLAELERIPVSVATRFDIASLTKLFTATLAMTLVDDGALALDAPVGDALPEFAGGERGTVTLRQLLTHTAGLREDYPLWDTPVGERLRTVLELPLERERGVFSYSCLGYVAAGTLMERVTGVPLRELMQARVIGPLGLRATGFGPVGPSGVAATEYEPWAARGIVHGEVHDEVAWALGGAAGNAGLFSTLGDLGRFGGMILGGGELDGHRVLSEGAVAAMLSPQVSAAGDPGFEQGIGFRIDAPEFMGELSGPRTVGHTGFTGTSIVIDTQRRLVVVLLSNRVHPSREGTDVSALRRAVAGNGLAAWATVAT